MGNDQYNALKGFFLFTQLLGALGVVPDCRVFESCVNVF
jgi:hypothetical protein